MNCETFNGKLDHWLDAGLDGELLPGEARALEAHAASCPNCAATMAAARRLQREAFALPDSREPPRDLWPGIAGRLEPRTARGRRDRGNWLRALAASVAVVAIFAGGMLASRLLLLQEQPGAARLAGQSMDAQRADDGFSVADARRILPASYVELVDAAAVGSGTEQALLRNLLIVNLAIRDTEAAIADDPVNSDLRELLSGLYAQENRILAQAERMRAARQAPARTTI